MADNVVFEIGPEEILADVKKAVFYLEAIVEARRAYFTVTDVPGCYRTVEHRLQRALTWVQLFRRCLANPEGVPFFDPEDIKAATRRTEKP